jgi:hypothetical protein
MTTRSITPFAITLLGSIVWFAPTQATTLNEVDLALSRTRHVDAAYLQHPVGEPAATRVQEDSESGTAGDYLSARVDTPLFQLSNVGSASGAPGVAQSVIGVTGISNIFLSGQLNDSTTDGSHILRGEAVEIITGVIPAARGNLEVNFSFDLQRMFVEIWDDSVNGVGDVGFDAVFGVLTYKVELNGDSAYLLDVSTIGGRELPSLPNPIITINARDPEAQDTLGFVVDDGTASGDIPRRYSFDNLSEIDLYLGTVAGVGIGDFETFEVKVSMVAQLLLPGFELGAGGRVNIGDPNGLSGAFGTLSLQTVADPPEPPTETALPGVLWLLLGGVTGLLIVTQRDTSV